MSYMEATIIRVATLSLFASLGCGTTPTGAAEGPSAPESREWIAFGECDPFGVSQIFVSSPDGSNKTQLTSGNRSSWFPSFSPGGQEILFAREAPPTLEVWIMDADGGNARPFLTGGLNLAAALSPDGQTIAYAHKAISEGPLKIWLADRNGSTSRRLTRAGAGIDENVPRWSPDGASIVFTSNRRESRYEIWVQEVGGGEPSRLTTAFFDESIEATQEQKVPAWSPDGTMIAYWSGVEMTDPRPDLPRDVWVMNADGTDQVRLVPGDDPNWSPDGRTIIHSVHVAGTPALGGVSPDGSHERILFNVRACRALQSSWTG